MIKINSTLIRVALCTLFLLSSMMPTYAAMYKYVTKDGSTLLTGTKLKGSGHKLVKIYQIKKFGYKSSKRSKKRVSRKSRLKNKSRKRKKLTGLIQAKGRDNGIIVGCGNPTHLSKKAHTYKKAIQIYSSIYDVDAELVHAIVRQESCFNEGAHSRVGAIGLMQLMPQTALGLRIKDPWNPEHNIQGGVKYIAQMLKRFDGNHKLAIAAYNAGPGNVNKYKGIPPFKETQNYVKKVYAEYKRLKKEGITYSTKIRLASK